MSKLHLDYARPQARRVPLLAGILLIFVVGNAVIAGGAVLLVYLLSSL